MIFNCPHCEGTLSDDGELAGRVVACAFCGGQMQVPLVPPPVTVAAVTPSIVIDSTSRKLKPRKRSSHIFLKLGTAICFFILTIVVLTMLDRIKGVNKGASAHGYMAGWREGGSGLSPNTASGNGLVMWYGDEKGLDEFLETLAHMALVTPRISRNHVLPRDESEIPEWKAAFKKGFKDASYGEPFDPAYGVR
ncbi:MAG: hypothetical protein K2Y37_22995 [Pirellulales bacterium]|nr:hypothetical protein [Pirellulales bacterium]